MRILAVVLSRMGAIGETLNPVAIIDDFAATLRVELDFRNEAAAMTEVGELFAAHRRVVVPTPISTMVTERVLVMSFIEGTPVDQANPDEIDDLVGLVRAGVQAWVGSTLEHGLFHGDVHAGNLFITPDGKIAFLDFGIMGRLDEHARVVLRKALPAVLIENDFAAVTEAVFELGAATRPVDLTAATNDVAELVGPVLTRPLSELSYGELLSDVLSVAVRYHVRLPASSCSSSSNFSISSVTRRRWHPTTRSSPTRAFSSTSSASEPRRLSGRCCRPARSAGRARAKWPSCGTRPR